MDINQCEEVISLEGEWSYRLDPEDKGINDKWFEQQFRDSLRLPGTLAENSIGEPFITDYEMVSDNVRNWRAEYNYIGVCWYQKSFELPEDWVDKRVFLELERIIEKSALWVDGVPAGDVSSLIAPHRYELTRFLRRPGKHVLTISIDNRDNFHLGVYGHSYTNETQTIWNGIVGKIQLYAVEKVSMQDVKIFTDFKDDLKDGIVRIASIIQNAYDHELSGSLEISIREKDSGQEVLEKVLDVKAKPGDTDFAYSFSIEAPIKCWDEFNPFLYKISLKMIFAQKERELIDKNTVCFGFRKIESRDGILKLNGSRIFLRGNLENCIHPLTGYPPCDVEYWKNIMKKVKEYGLNHLRFHSNCPPDAAFQAADETGIYLQIEGPIWLDEWFIGLGTYKEHYDFMPAEAERIIKTYGNHPSFCIYSNGNELRGDFNLMHETIKMCRKIRPDLLYTLTSNYDRVLDSEDDVFVSVEADKNGMRGNRFKSQMAETMITDYSAAVSGRRIPLIGHESGQFFVYPEIRDVERYKGCIKPVNLLTIKKDLEKKGLMSQADKYVKSSGTLAQRLYKEEIEAYLRTEGFGGFQLLGIQDFPGQCTATVGLLNTFWDSKGIISGRDFRKFCCETVPIAKMAKRVYSSREKLDAEIIIAHFGPDDIRGAEVAWNISSNYEVVAEGVFKGVDIRKGTQVKVGSIENIQLDSFTKPSALSLTVNITGTAYANSWNLWVFPEIQASVEDKAKHAVEVFYNWDEKIEEKLKNGERVLLIPGESSFTNRAIYEASFYPVFWSPVFTNSKKPCGLYVNSKAPFGTFPTDSFADYQWYRLLEHSYNIDIDHLPAEFIPIVDIVPNYYYNHRLTNLLEARVGSGILIVCTIQLDDPETGNIGKWLKLNLLDYLRNAEIRNIPELNDEQLKGIFKSSTMLNDIREHFSKEDFID